MKDLNEMVARAVREAVDNILDKSDFSDCSRIFLYDTFVYGNLRVSITVDDNT